MRVRLKRIGTAPRLAFGVVPKIILAIVFGIIFAPFPAELAAFPAELAPFLT